MSQILSQLPRQLLQQQQRLTPQLIQAMNILQLNTLALEGRIAQELDENPALEAAGTDVETPAEPADDRDYAERAEGDVPMRLTEDGSEDFGRLDTLVREYDWIDDDGDFRGTRSRSRLSEESDNKLEAMSQTAARPVSLADYLHEQWALVDVDEQTRRIGDQLIDALDENGRMNTPLGEIAQSLEPPVGVCKVEDVLARIQQLDPPGVGARDVAECLVLQLEALPEDTELPRRIIEEQFENLRKNRLPQIAKSLGVELDDVKDAIRTISRLSLRPTADVIDQTSPPVVPDVIVDYDEESDRYQARLARGGGGRELRISPEFRRLLERSKGDKRSREFIREKLEAASALIDAVKYRGERLLEVAQAVVDAQRDFLDHGEQHLKVLRMSDLAERFDCDPSTISRTVDNKWVQTPRGIYPLRKFFTGGTESGEGEALGWESIKAKVKEIVDNEDKSKPLSDDAIVKKLHSMGIDIKRRTVAKYRGQLGIPTARQRKSY